MKVCSAARAHTAMTKVMLKMAEPITPLIPMSSLGKQRGKFNSEVRLREVEGAVSAQKALEVFETRIFLGGTKVNSVSPTN